MCGEVRILIFSQGAILTPKIKKNLKNSVFLNFGAKMAPRAIIQKFNFTLTPETDLFALGLLQLHLGGGGHAPLALYFGHNCIYTYVYK